MLHTTFARLREARACKNRYRYLARKFGGIRKYGKDTPIRLDAVLEHNGIDDAVWALRATEEESERVARLLAADYAEHVLPYFEEDYPDDKRPRVAIAMARRYALGKVTEKERSSAFRAAEQAANDMPYDSAARAAAIAAGSATAAASELALELAGNASMFDENWDAERQWQAEKFLEMLNGG